MRDNNIIELNTIKEDRAIKYSVSKEIENVDSDRARVLNIMNSQEKKITKLIIKAGEFAESLPDRESQVAVINMTLEMQSRVTELRLELVGKIQPIIEDFLTCIKDTR